MSYVPTFLTPIFKLCLKIQLPEEGGILFGQMREEELGGVVTQEAQSVSAHWCSELAGLSLWSPINTAVCPLLPAPRRATLPAGTRSCRTSDVIRWAGGASSFHRTYTPARFWLFSLRKPGQCQVTKQHFCQTDVSSHQSNRVKSSHLRRF